MPSPSYFQLSGAGNDFLALVEPEEAPSAESIRAWCRRGLSLGADGLFLLHRTPGGARMIHHNADGGRSDLCLNGSRCAARLAFYLGWGQEKEEIVLTTDAGDLRARLLGEHRTEVELPPFVGRPQRRCLRLGEQDFDGWFAPVGVPHFVLPWADLDDLPIAELGRQLRSHPDLGDDGANVNFVRYPDDGESRPGGLAIRTYERGVEAETLACGTGVVASVATGLAMGVLELPAAAHTRGGFELTVDGEVVDECLRSCRLAGDARILAHGEILPGAGRLPNEKT